MTRQDLSSDTQPASMTPVQTAHNLTRDVLVEIVARIQGRMYLDLDENGGEFWNPGKQWSCCDLCQDVQDILHRPRLVPSVEQPYEDKAAGEGGDTVQLVEFAEASGLEPDDIDEIVRECVAATASAINNSGLWGQIEYLLDQLGHADTKMRLAEFADS